MRKLAWVVAVVFVACGGKTVDGTDSGADASTEAAPTCAQDGFKCSSASDCCSAQCDPQLHTCGFGDCAPDLANCVSDSECCSGICSLGDNLCGCVKTHDTGCGVDSDCCTSSNACVEGVCQ